MNNFGYQPGILDYWMLLTDWRNGSFVLIPLALTVLLVVSHARDPNKFMSHGATPAPGKRWWDWGLQSARERWMRPDQAGPTS
jgi:hypothetical protein